MKRLKYYLVNMENDTHTYKEMYDGKVFVEINTGTKILEHLEEHNDTIYRLDSQWKCERFFNNPCFWIHVSGGKYYGSHQLWHQITIH